MSAFRTISHRVDVCVVGGGMAGVCAAIAAARHGAAVALIQDRPVLGGAASSEMRVHIGGAAVGKGHPASRETGIIEELQLENIRRNPQRSYSIWDTVLHEKVKAEPNIRLLLNATCQNAETAGERIASVTAWQMTTQTWHVVRARIFIDCSGDAVLAPLSGALWRMGREGRSEYNESHAPEEPNPGTMGMSCLFHARDTGAPVAFEPFPWAYTFASEDDIPYGPEHHRHFEMGYWWVESGGMQDAIHDAEEVRDDLLKVVYGMWDHIKNRCVHREAAANWALDWVQFLPTKRESRRYIGLHVVTQNDVEARGPFPDTVCHGGWPMDDHHSGGFHSPEYKKQATIFHPAPSPYGIPLRALCSRNVENLMFAGRCASFTHMAMSSSRVMGTCAVMGQAAGTAAAVAVGRCVGPREAGETAIREIQRLLYADDVLLPGVPAMLPGAAREARLTASRGDPEVLRDGVSRPEGEKSHRWECAPGDSVEYRFAAPRRVERLVAVFDSAFHRSLVLSHHGPQTEPFRVPPEMVKAFRVEVDEGTGYRPLHRTADNCRRLVAVPVGADILAVRLTVEETWGAGTTGIYALWPDGGS